jgi:hypothetical protein
MTVQLKPRITDYKGIRFRSKSEAIFARSLDIANERPSNVSVIWEYEPQEFRYDDYVPDFLVALKFTDAPLYLALIEYKPSKPTDAYITEWLKKADFYCAIKHPVSLFPGLCYGSPFNGDYGCIKGNAKEFNAWAYGMQIYAAEAKDYRFDLEQGAA